MKHEEHEKVKQGRKVAHEEKKKKDTQDMKKRNSKKS